MDGYTAASFIIAIIAFAVGLGSLVYLSDVFKELKNLRSEYKDGYLKLSDRIGNISGDWYELQDDVQKLQGKISDLQDSVRTITAHRNTGKIIAIDFDNTLFETEYPTIIRPCDAVINRAIEEKKNGARLILWTCREGEALCDAIQACNVYGLQFDAINDNLPDLKEEWGNNPRKIFANEYWDDKNVTLGVKYSELVEF